MNLAKFYAHYVEAMKPFAHLKAPVGRQEFEHSIRAQAQDPLYLAGLRRKLATL